MRSYSYMHRIYYTIPTMCPIYSTQVRHINNSKRLVSIYHIRKKRQYWEFEMCVFQDVSSIGWGRVSFRRSQEYMITVQLPGQLEQYSITVLNQPLFILSEFRYLGVYYNGKVSASIVQGPQMIMLCGWRSSSMIRW
jgi:hypothetical protein